jgi:predicted permease
VSAFPDWWIYPLLSVAVSGAGFVFGYIVLRSDKLGIRHPEEFLGLTTFQNSGYLPLPLVASLLPSGTADRMFIIIFLFLLGFNMMIFSAGVFILSPAGTRRFDPKKMLNPPVVATLAALLVSLAGGQRFVPEWLLRPAELLGRCTIPLSVLVVGGNLALMKVEKMGGRPVISALLIKLIILPLFFFGIIFLFRPNPLMALLLILQAAMPPAVLLTVVCRNQDCEDKLITQSIFYGHLVSIITIPLILALFQVVTVILY